MLGVRGILGPQHPFGGRGILGPQQPLVVQPTQHIKLGFQANLIWTGQPDPIHFSFGMTRFQPVLIRA